MLARAHARLDDQAQPPVDAGRVCSAPSSRPGRCLALPPTCPTLPDGGVLDISEMDYRTAAGSRLEGSGLRPDMEVAPTLEDLRRRRDRALALALELLKAQEDKDKKG